ncbi:PQQ-binding-like beta-propeller repeat protein [Planctomycetales bacterium ZRK34]|nr:PQQ-binding-like beta-propeller repeat protein [Planctomycetales bacterium ZRK34]
MHRSVYALCRRLNQFGIAAGVPLLVFAVTAGLDARPAIAAQVYVQDSPAAAELLAAARDRTAKDELDDAARLVQRVFDEHGSKLLERASSDYTEARRMGQRLLIDNPALLKLYRELHEPIAAAALQEAGSDREKLIEVVHRYALTDAGLTAGLRVAGLAMEAGQMQTAAVLLDQLADHPHHGTSAALLADLTARAAILHGDMEQYHAARARLIEAGQRDLVATLDRLAVKVTHRPAPSPLTPLDPLPPAEAPGDVNQPLWSVSMGGAEQYLIDLYQIDQQQIGSSADEGRYLNLMPYVAGPTLYLNDGHVATALEPSSGRQLWRTEVVPNDDEDQVMNRPYQRWLPNGVDVNLVAIGEGRAVGLFGFGAMVQQAYYYRRPAESQMACLDAATGQLLWELKPEQIQDDLEGAFWYGRPIVDGGRVYATIRRRQRTQFQDAYVVALDLREGRVLWQRHLVSTALTDRNVVPSLCHMTLADGYLYVDSGLGAVAKLAAADGQIDWLTLVPIDEDQSLQSSYQPWGASAPVLVEAGLLVFDDWMDVIRQFDPATGRIIEALPASRWGSPNYLGSIDGDVLAIGSNVGRFDGQTLTRRWMYESPDSMLAGRAAVAGERMYLPVGSAVELIDLTDGKLVKRLPVRVPANLLALDGQLLTVDRQGVNSYSSWQVAADQLRQRAAAMPDDPRPMMALAWLSYNTQRRDSLLEALDRALQIVAERRPDAETTQALFTQLLSMSEQTPIEDHDLRGALFERMAALTSSPAQEVTYRLALARYLESTDKPAEAVAQYQTILADPIYRRQLFTHETGSRQAGLEAQRRLQLLIKQRGDELYASFDAYAQRRFDDLSNQVDAAALIELAEAYPLSHAAVEALIKAADYTAADGHVREAVSLLRRAGQSTDDPATLGRIFGREAELFEQAAQPHRARRVLRSMMAAYPNVTPRREGKPVDAAAWIKQLNDQTKARGLMARINPPLTSPAAMLEGTLLSAVQQDPDASPPPVFLLRLPQSIQLRRAEDLSIVWTRPLETDEPVQLLTIDPQSLWLFYPQSLRMTKLTVEDGKMLWDQDTLAETLDAINTPEASRHRTPQEQHVRRLLGPGRLINQIRMQRNAGPQIDELPQPMVAVSDLGIALVDHRGRVVVVNAETGKIRWQAATIVRFAASVKMDSRHLMIAGSDEDDAPLLCVYDASTGQMLHRLIKPRNQNVTWMDLTEDGVLVYVSAMQVEAFDLNRGQSTWLTEPGVRLLGEGGAWLSGRRLILMSQEGDLLWVDVADGRVTSRMPLRDTISEPFAITPDMGGWIVRGAKAAVAVDDDGRMRWRDAIIEPHRLVEHVVTDRYVVLLTAPAEGQFSDPNARTLYILDRATGALQYKSPLAGAQPLDELKIMDGKLLLSGAGLTAAISSAP